MNAQSGVGWFAFAAALFAAGCERSASQAVAPRETHPAAPLEASNLQAGAPTPAATPTAAAAPASVAAVTLMDHRPLLLAAACRGSCPVGLTALAGERALALWPDADGPWAQRFDLARGSALGAPLALGEVDRDDLPYIFALPNGDAALFGVLPNGRVTFALGSEVAARRVAPKVVVPRNPHGVQSLAASATSTGLVLLILREAAEKDLRADNTPIDAELHWLDSQGRPLRAPLIWKPQFGVAARLAACGDELFLAWDAVGSVQVTRLTSSGQGRADMLLPAPQRHWSAYPGALLCTPTGARLFAGWKKSDGFRLEPKLSVAAISGTGALTARGRWTTLPLPGEPKLSRLKESPLGAYATSAGVKVLLGTDSQQRFVALDPAAEKVAELPGAPKLPPATPCIPTNDGRRVLCVESQASERKPGCKDYLNRLTAAFVGEASAAPPSTPSAAPEPEPYFDVRGAAIPDPWAQSDADAKEEHALLRCGEPGWDGLRKAIQGFCEAWRVQKEADKNQGKDATSERELKANCGQEPFSLLFQATYCTDEPLLCEHPGVSSILSVDRSEFERGSEGLILKFGHCELRFAGKGDTWHVVARECGD